MVGRLATAGLAARGTATASSDAKAVEGSGLL
jgi:hypothetical protein